MKHNLIMLCTAKIRRLLSTYKSSSFFVTTPIFYVNAAPHIGHLYSAVVADAIHRYVKLRNNRVTTKFSTGTDEHGTKIQQAANLNKVPVDEYCSKISAMYRETFQAAGVEYSDFIRTTEQRHKDAVAHFWNSLKSKGHIYSAEYRGWYCVSDEMFLTESQLKENPDGTKVSAESGHPVEWTQEVNYMFALSTFQNDVVNWVKSGGRIRPLKFEKILLNYLEEPLPDISVSRPSSRVHWGIRVPGDSTQSIYVWLDALVNYLTCVGYPGRQHSNQWPPALQVIGKDILKFHGIYWPAFLIAAGLEPPQKLLVHSHWTVDEQKMSKSKFNVVDPNQRAELYTMEGLRYFLLREGVPHSDGNYSDVKVLRILNAELADTLGNLLSRSCAKTLNPRQVFPKISDHHFQELCEMDAAKRLIAAVNQLPDKCVEHYESYNFYLVIDQVMAALHAANNFFEMCKPWELRKRLQRKAPSKSPFVEGGNNLLFPLDEDVLKLETIISVTMDTLRKCAIILQPIIPSMSRKLLDKLAVPLDERSWDNLNSSVWQSDSKFSERYLESTDAVLFRRILQEGEKAKVKKNS